MSKLIKYNRENMSFLCNKYKDCEGCPALQIRNISSIGVKLNYTIRNVSYCEIESGEGEINIYGN